ncbi:EamA family transporter RarD [Roseovarius salinarum]|uniref:EamA family transporter RarD n=1 Tax=Roseovarius salinarum TaxID=1981892 RepID=UPI000C338AF0|nr:EamA family transporter RarD [Roseovarius salinarum]
MREAVKGVAAMVLACTIWGLSPLFYKLLTHIPPIEILAHRTLWSLAFFAGVLAVQGRLAWLARAVGTLRSARVIGFAALMISTNWFVFITSIQIGKALEASMGYYTFPLVAVLLGAVVFRERLGRAQRWAVALAAAAVITLTAGLGVAPWIALVLATTFGLYGVAKKHLEVGPVVSVTGEVLLLSPIALAVLAVAHADGGGAFGAAWGDSLLLAASGVITATPLILFSYATRRVTLASVGLIQYLNPTLQFLVATLVFRELFTPWHALAFGMIWTALAIYTVAALRQDRAARRAAASASGVSMTSR